MLDDNATQLMSARCRERDLLQDPLPIILICCLIKLSIIELLDHCPQLQLLQTSATVRGWSRMVYKRSSRLMSN